MIKRGIDPNELIENNYTVADLASARVAPEEIAAIAKQHQDTITLEQLSEVSGITAEILRDNGYAALDLMKVGFSEDDLVDGGFSHSSVDRAAKTMEKTANKLAAASTTPVNDSSTTLIVVAIAAVILILVVVGALVYVKKNGGGARSGNAGTASFENPMYDSAMQHSAGYMDVPGQHQQGGGSSGYMDVPANSPSDSSGYMDVNASVNANANGNAGYMDVSANG